MKIVLAACLVILTSAKVNSTGSDKPGWMNMTEVAAQLKTENKPVLIDLYTGWCYWCKVMDKKTYTNGKVAQYINEHFYPAKVDAESREIVRWKDKDYNYNASYKINDFALYLTSGQLAFPTTVIIPDNNSEPVSIAGFLEPKEMEPILKYFGEGAYKTKTFVDFRSTFKSTW